MNEQRSIVAVITGVLYPFIILFGLYIILNGHHTPGGGFQGGAILSALFIGRYIVEPRNDFNIRLAHDVEKALFALIILLPVAFLFFLLNRRLGFLNEPYLVVMNLLIGIKVAIGLTILVFRYAFYEER